MSEDGFIAGEQDNLDFLNPYHVEGLKGSDGGNVYCDGGAGLALSMLQQGLIDEMILSVIPTKLQQGTLLFAGGQVPDAFEHRATAVFASGLIQHTYVLKHKNQA